MTITFSTLKIILAKISFYYEQEQLSGRKATKLFEELFIGDIWWNKTVVVDKLTLLYLREEYLFSPYNIKTFKGRQVPCVRALHDYTNFTAKPSCSSLSCENWGHSATVVSPKIFASFNPWSGWTRYLYRIKKATALMHHSWDNKEGSHKGKFQFDVKDFRAFYSTIRSVRCKTKTDHDFVTCVQLSRAHRLRASASSSHWFVVLSSLAFIGHCNWFVLVWRKRPNKASSYWLFHC